LPLGAFRPHRLGGIRDRRRFLWRKHNGLPLQFARCILRLWVPLAWLLRRFLRWNHRSRFHPLNKLVHNLAVEFGSGRRAAPGIRFNEHIERDGPSSPMLAKWVLKAFARARRYCFHFDEVAEAEAQGLPYMLVPRELSREEWIEQYSGDKGPGEDDPAPP
jgi:hypothetical protein